MRVPAGVSHLIGVFTAVFFLLMGISFLGTDMQGVGYALIALAFYRAVRAVQSFMNRSTDDD